MYTKEEVQEQVVQAVCDGIQPRSLYDGLPPDLIPKNKGTQKIFHVLDSDRTGDYEHGWIFHCVERTSTGILVERGGLYVAFNKHTGKIETYGLFDEHAQLHAENFKRTGAI
jgi:hypothetical protein